MSELKFTTSTLNLSGGSGNASFSATTTIPISGIGNGVTRNTRIGNTVFAQGVEWNIEVKNNRTNTPVSASSNYTMTSKTATNALAAYTGPTPSFTGGDTPVATGVNIPWPDYIAVVPPEYIQKMVRFIIAIDHNAQNSTTPLKSEIIEASDTVSPKSWDLRYIPELQRFQILVDEIKPLDPFDKSIVNFKGFIDAKFRSTYQGTGSNYSDIATNI